MTRATHFAAGLLCLLLAVWGEARAASRVALVVGGEGPAIRSAIDLATVKLSSVEGVELLERASIERVLDEQKLTLAGLADAGQAVAAGKLLSADVLSVVEAAPDGKALLGLVVFDAKTGLRLWDAALPAGGPEKQAEGISEALKSALKKQAAGRNGLRTVGFVAVRNADLPHSMDSYCDALGQLVERRLVAAPEVGVLERQRLETVTGERALPTQAAEKELLGSLVQLDLEVRRGPQGEGLRATVLLNDGKGKQLGKLTVAVKDSDQVGGAEALAKGICEALKAAPAAGNGDTARESSRFYREAVQLWSFNQHARALRAAESACALHPQDPVKRLLLAEYLIVRGGNILSPGPVPPRSIAATPETVALACALMRRGIDLRALALSTLPEKNARALYFHVTNNFGVDNQLTICLWKFSALDTRRLTAESKQQMSDVGAAIDRWICNEYLETLASACEREPALFHIYSTQLFVGTGQLRLAALDAQHFTRKLIAVMERWLAAADKLTPVQMGEAEVRPWMILTQSSERLRHAVRWSPGPHELELLDGLFDKMQKHKHDLIRFQGSCGHVWAAMLRKTSTPQECYTMFGKAKREFLEVLKGPRRAEQFTEGLGYFQLMTVFFSQDAFGFVGAGIVSDELYELWEEMLSRKILLDQVLRVTPFVTTNPVPKPSRRLALLDRTIELIDTPRIPYYGGESKSIKGPLQQLRAKILTENPGLAGKQAPLPWERVQTVLDVTDLPGIREFRMPVLAGDHLYVVGLGGTRGREFLQGFRVPLARGEIRPLGKAPIAWPPTPISRYSTPIPDTVTGAQTDARHLYVSTRSEGIYAFPLDGGPARRLDAGKNLPSQGVESMVYYNGRLYAALEGGYLVSLDPASDKFDVLASSRRREKSSPFDDGEVFAVPYLAADTERNRILFLLHQGQREAKGPSGLWAWDVKTREFNRLLETGGIDMQMAGRPIRDGRLLLVSTINAVEFDLSRDKHVLLWAWLRLNGPVLDPKTALCQEGFKAYPTIYLDGWLWSEAPFGRISIAKKKQEPFPTPQRKGDAPVGHTDVLQVIGKDRLLFGGSSVLWLLTLRKEQPPQP